MGAFVLITDEVRPSPTVAEVAVRKSLTTQGFAKPAEIRFPGYVLLIYDKLVAPVGNLASFDRGDYCAATGTFLYKGKTGPDGLKAIYADFDAQATGGKYGLDESRLHGAFCIVLRKADRTWMFIDRIGVYKVYRSSSGSIFSSSFLAILATRQRPRADIQALYEYVLQGATYGDDTLIDDIKLLSADYLCEPGKSIFALERIGFKAPNTVDGSLEQHAERIEATLKQMFSDIAAAFGRRIDTALSGGYDSRLILALLFDQCIRPSVHVYGRDDDPDVVVAKSIAAGEGFPISHTDKTPRGMLSIEQVEDVLERSFQAFDGFAPDGIFDSGTDLATRKERCQSGALALNGGGGEIFRDFFYLPDRSFTVRQLLWSFYTQFDPRVCIDPAFLSSFYDRLGDKVKKTLGITENRLHRPQVELVYPLFRCRYWMGRNNALNNRFGSVLTPFIEPGLVRQSVSVPLKFKQVGRFEARLIERISPRLAAYTSVYNFAFNTPPPLQARLKTLSARWRPPILRRYAFRLKARASNGEHPYYLSGSYRDSVMAPGCPRTSPIFRAGQMTNTAQFNRLCTVEYLFQKMDVPVEQE